MDFKMNCQHCSIDFYFSKKEIQKTKANLYNENKRKIYPNLEQKDFLGQVVCICGGINQLLTKEGNEKIISSLNEETKKGKKSWY